MAITPSDTAISNKDRSNRWANLHIKMTLENEISNAHYGFAQAINKKNQIII